MGRQALLQAGGIGLLVVAANFLTGAAGVPVSHAQQPIVLRAMVRDYTLQQESPWHSAVARFRSKYPNVRVDLEGLPYEQQRSKFLLAASAGQAPDIVQVDCIWLGEYVTSDLLRDISDWVEAWDEREDLIEVFAEGAKWNGRTYGVWLNSDVRLLTWRKDIFRAAGLDPEKPPRTWQELIETAVKVNRPPAVWGYAFPAMSTDHTADRWYPFLWQGGGDILTRDYRQPAFHSAAGVQALQLLVDLMNTYRVTPRDVLSGTEASLTDGFLAGKYAMMIKVGEHWAEARRQGYTREKYMDTFGAAPLPIPLGGQMATGSGGWILAISRQSRYPDLAWELIKMVTSPDNVLPFLVERAMVPTRKSLLQMRENFQVGSPYFGAVEAVVPYTHFRPPIPQYLQISSFIVTAIQRALTQQLTPEESLRRAAEQTAGLLRR